jgi:hypothetical protein
VLQCRTDSSFQQVQFAELSAAFQKHYSPKQELSPPPTLEILKLDQFFRDLNCVEGSALQQLVA